MPEGQTYQANPGFGNPVSYNGAASTAAIVAVTVTGSPFTFVAPSTGELQIASGTISVVAILDGVGGSVTVATATGVHIHMSSRWKGVQVTYAGTILPVLTFVPD